MNKSQWSFKPTNDTCADIDQLFFISLLLIKTTFFLIHLKEIKAVVQWTHVTRISKKKPTT